MPRTSIVSKILNTLDEFINPATEEKQDAIITAINNVSGLQQSTDMEGGGIVAVGTTAVEATFTGTPETLFIQSVGTNAGILYVGKSDVTNTGANALFELEPGDVFKASYDDTSNAVYVVSDTAAQSFIKGALL